MGPVFNQRILVTIKNKNYKVWTFEVEEDGTFIYDVEWIYAGKREQIGHDDSEGLA